MKRKEAVNSFDVARLAVELDEALDGAFLEKVYQPTREEVLLRCRQPGVGRIDVAIGVGTYVAVTSVERDNPPMPPSFSMQLRRHLSNGRIRGVRQVGFDRILVFTISKRDAEYELVVELFHDGNVVLVQDGRIVLPLIHQTFADRTVRPGRDYELPPPRFDPTQAGLEDLAERVRASDRDTVRTLATQANLGGQWAEEVLARCGVDGSTPAPDLSDGELTAIHGALTDLLDAIRSEAQPSLARRDGTPVDCAPVPLRTWGDDLEVERVESLSFALDAIFAPPPAQRQKRQQATVDAKAGGLEHRVRSIEKALEEFREGQRMGQIIGDAIYASFAELEQLLAEIDRRRNEGGWDAVEADLDALTMSNGGRVLNVRPRGGTITVRLPKVDGDTVDADINVSKSVPDNANDHYESGKKMREKITGAEQALADARAELQALRERGEALEEEIEMRTTREATHRFWFDSYRWFVASTGNLVVAGRDARTNDSVVKKHMENDDRYVHADVHGAPSVIVKAGDDGGVPRAALEEAAQFASSYSRAWSSGVAGGEAYWVSPSQVSQTPESGEYLARGAFIVRGKRTFHRVELEAAVGEVEHDGHRKIMGGPPAAVEARAGRYVRLAPGDEDPNAIADKLAAEFKVPVEEVQRVMPPGPCRVLQVVGMPEDVVA